MARNVEFKARVDEHDAIRRALVALGPSATERIEQADTYFAVAKGRLKLREFGDGTGELIYYRRPDRASIKLSKYRRVAVNDSAAIGRLLSDALPVRGVVNKVREVVLLGATRVHLDTVERLGTFVEVEVVLSDDQSAADGERLATELLDALGISESALISGAYIDLLDAG